MDSARTEARCSLVCASVLIFVSREDRSRINREHDSKVNFHSAREKQYEHDDVLPIPHLQVRRFPYSLIFSGPHSNKLHRTLDPIFAVSVGVAAAVVRINREEKEKGKSFEESKASLGRRAALAWKEVMGEEEKGAVKARG
jgi:hypothetical protein